MLACLLIKCCKKMTAYPGCAGLAHLPFVLTEHICSCRASEASETLSGVYKFELMRYAYIYIYYKYSTLPCGISINTAPKVRIFTKAEGRGKYSLLRVQYYLYSTRKGYIYILFDTLSLYNCANLLERQSIILDS